jgi:acetolactate synthase regulatory subunit
MPMPSVAASAADANLCATAYFSVHARAEPGVMPRVLEQFEKRGLVPAVWHSARFGADRGRLTIDIAVAGLGRELTRYIADCLRQIVHVETVLTTESEPATAERRSA